MINDQGKHLMKPDRLSAHTTPAYSPHGLALLRATNDVIWELDIRTGKVVWNAELERVFGHSPDAGSKHPQGGFHWWLEHLHPDDREAQRESFERAADTLLRSARGFGHNDFKIELARRAIVRALAQAARGTPQSQADKRTVGGFA